MAAIITEGLTRQFGERTAVDHLTLEIASGAVFGFLGPNGAGKTTTVRMLTALVAPSSGYATIAGYQLGRDNQAIRRAVGILTEAPGMYEQLTAEQNLLFFARLYGLSRSHARQQVERHLRDMGLWERRSEIVGTFSKGMRQKLAIARALIHDPQVVFLDEPTSGLDPEAARSIREGIKQLRQAGRTVFLTSHNLPEVEELCDQVALFRGRLLRLDAPARLRAELFGRRKLLEFGGAAQQWQPLVAALPFVTGVQPDEHSLVVTLDDPAVHSAPLLQALVDAGAPVLNIQEQTATLEDVYMRLVGAVPA